jgi:hypothetical protein
MVLVLNPAMMSNKTGGDFEKHDLIRSSRLQICHICLPVLNSTSTIGL